MVAVRRGNMSALEEVVRRHQQNVLALAYRMLGRWDLAEDVAQEAFLRVYQAARHYRPAAAFKTWLYRIVVNLCLDARRRLRKWPGPLPAESTLQAGPGDCDPLETREQAELVQLAVAGLPQRQRTALILHRYQGLSRRQIAEVTGWTESAVESLLVRAYGNLRNALVEIVQE